MFNIGGGELIVILMIALIVLGPKRLPDAARTIGKTMGELRRLSSSFQNEVRTALNTADDPDQIATRRNLLGTDQPADAPSPDAHPPRRKPLGAAPDPDAAEPPRPAPKRAAPLAAKPTTAKTTKPKNGTAVEKPAASKPPAPPATPS